MSSSVDIASTFIQGAPPGELNEVVNDIKSLTSDDDPTLIAKLKPAFQKYNEEQLITVKLPGASQPVLVSKHNRLPDGRYFDSESRTSFEFDHVTQKASGSQSYTNDSSHSDLVNSILKTLSAHFAEHYPPSSSSAYTACPAGDSSSSVAILLSTTKSSPSNFLSGRWRSEFVYSPSSSTLSGTMHVDVHYYEDGNVALATNKSVQIADVDSTGDAVVRRIAAVEKAYQEEINRSFVAMNESSFKGLRRQLPVTRQRVEWEKIRGYGLGSDLRGEARR